MPIRECTNSLLPIGDVTIEDVKIGGGSCASLGISQLKNVLSRDMRIFAGANKEIWQISDVKIRR